MALQIANPIVVDKVERLAQATGLTETAAVEQAVDRLLEALEAEGPAEARVRALLAQLDLIPNRPDAFEPLKWDDAGLPR